MEAEGTMTFDRLGCPAGAKQAGHPKHWLSLLQGTLRGSAGSGFGAARTQRVQALSCPGSLATAAGMVTAEPRAVSCEPLQKPLMRSSTSQPVGTSAGTLTQLHLLLMNSLCQKGCSHPKNSLGICSQQAQTNPSIPISFF